jgi:hypothetical protein
MPTYSQQVGRVNHTTGESAAAASASAPSFFAAAGRTPGERRRLAALAGTAGAPAHSSAATSGILALTPAAAAATLPSMAPTNTGAVARALPLANLEPEPEPEPIVGGGSPRIVSSGTPRSGGLHQGFPSSGSAAADDAAADDDDDETEEEMATAMEHARQLSEIRQLQRRNIREGVGDAQGTDECVVAMYAALIQTAGLTYRGVIQHDKVAKGLTQATGLNRVQAHRNLSGTDCSLCLEELPIGLRVAKLPCCGNVFHFSVVRPHETWAADPNQESCCGIENCLEQVGSCPLCRQDLHDKL